MYIARIVGVFLGVLVVMLTAAGANAQHRPSQSPVTLSVSASSKAWWMGARHVPFTVVVTNNGPAPIKFPNPETSAVPDSVVDLTLTDSRGVHPDRLVAGVLRADADQASFVHLAKGQSHTISLDRAGIANEYETVPSGRYRLSLVLRYTDSKGRAHWVNANVNDVDVRDVRDFVASSIAVVTPVPEGKHKFVDPDSSAHAAVVATPGGAYWLAYWTERDPIVTDSQTQDTGKAQPAAPFMRKWVSTLYWLGRVGRSSPFIVSRERGNDLLVRFTDINGNDRAVEIDHFWAYPKFVKGAKGAPTTTTTIDL